MTRKPHATRPVSWPGDGRFIDTTRADSINSRAALYAALALALAFVSVALTGFDLVSNNVFHLPYVLNLPAEPAFRNDAFYATLKFFTSIVWPPLRLVATEANVESLFALGHFISRASTFAALIFLLRVNRMPFGLGLVACLAVLALTPWLRAASVVGGHDMLSNFFSHTSLAWTFVFLALGLLQMRKHTASAAMIGVAFAVNAFVGIWLMAISLVVLAFDRAFWTPRNVRRAFAAFLLFASPVLVWIAVAVGSSLQVADGGTPGRYSDYIRLVFPQHFLIEASSARSLAVLAGLFVVGLLAARHLAAARFWTLVQAACLMLFLVGIPLPYLWDNRFVFNLHLLRSDGIEQALAVILAAIAGVKLVCTAASGRRQLAGAVVLFSLATIDSRAVDLGVIALALAMGLVPDASASESGARGTPGRAQAFLQRHANTLMILCVAALAIATVYQFAKASAWLAPAARMLLALGLLAMLLFMRHRAGVRRALDLRRPLLGALAVLAVATSAAASVQRVQAERRVPSPAAQSWNALTDWIRMSDSQGVFLIPVKTFKDGEDRANWFQLDARRPVWVDWKQGAAGMWWPPFRHQWVERMNEVSALRAPEDFVDYARAHGIENIIVETRPGGCPVPSTVARATAHYTYCRLPSVAKASQ